MKQVLIGGVSNRWGGVIAMSLIAKIKQVRDIFKSLISLERVKTNQNGGFLTFGRKIAFKNVPIVLVNLRGWQ